MLMLILFVFIETIDLLINYGQVISEYNYGKIKEGVLLWYR